MSRKVVVSGTMSGGNPSSVSLRLVGSPMAATFTALRYPSPASFPNWASSRATNVDADIGDVNAMQSILPFFSDMSMWSMAFPMPASLRR